MNLKAKLVDNLKDFTVRHIEEYESWYLHHIDRLINNFEHVKVGNTVKQHVEYDGEEWDQDVKIEKIEISPINIEGGGGIIVHITGGYSPVNYYELDE